MQPKERRLFGIVILIHCILTAWFTSRQGVTFDEPDYFKYAFEWAKGHPERTTPFMDSKTPMVAVSLIPALFKSLLPDTLLQHDIFFYLKAGRPFIYVYQLLGAFVVCCWMYRITGPKKWILPFLFYCFDPLVFSYGMLIGTDIPSAALLVTAVYAAWRYKTTGTVRYWYILSIATALAIITKASMLFCYPLWLLLFTYDVISKKRPGLKKSATRLLQFILIQLLVINLAYYGKGNFTAFGSFHFDSNFFANLQSSLSVVAKVPVPLPAPFIQGLDILQHHAETGGCKPESTYWGIWLFDKVSCDKSLWYYYIATTVFKFPLLIWLFIIACIIRFIAANNKLQQVGKSIFLWLPFFYFLLILSFANKFQIGIRHALIMMPFLYIGLAHTINWLYTKHKMLLYALMFLHVASVVRYLPNLMAYTNEIVWNKTRAYKIIRDSSLDYGQSKPWINKFIALHPDYKTPTIAPDTGRFVITVGDLFSEHEGPLKNIAWLRNNFQPVGHYRYTILLFDVSAAALKEKGLTR
jgi:hypothetical protein